MKLYNIIETRRINGIDDVDTQDLVSLAQYLHQRYDE